MRRAVGGGRIAAAAVAGLAALALGLPAGAAAASDDIVAADNAFLGGTGSGGAFLLDGGARATLSNTGINRHNAISNANGPDGGKLFSSPTLNGGSSGKLEGTQYLAAGEYPFFCSIHPSEMTATLKVEGGSPLPRPSIGVALPRQSLGKVRRTGRLVTRVKAATDSAGVQLSARLRKRVLARSSKLDLAAGEQRKVVLKLSRKARKQLKGLRKARVKLTGTVPFGAPASASRVLR